MKHPVCPFGQGMKDAVSAGRVHDYHRVLRCRFECTEDLPHHYLLFSPFEKGGIMFDQDNRVIRLAEDRQELVCSECPADFEWSGSPIDVGQDTGVIPANVEEHVPLQLLIGVQCCSHHISRSNHRTERSRLEGEDGQRSNSMPGTLSGSGLLGSVSGWCESGFFD
jgi:hypothetical protein